MFDWITPDFGPPGVLTAALAAFWAVSNIAFSTPKRMAALRERALGHPDGARWLYRRIVRLTGLLSALVLLVVLADPGIDTADVGLAGLTDDRLALAAGILAVATPVFWLANRRAVARQGPANSAHAARVAHLIPRNSGDRAWAAVTAVVVGIGEELVFRGLLIAAAVGLLGISAWWAALASMVVFALNHRYQGLPGMVSSFGFAAAATGLYALGGSLLPAMALHVAVDLSALLSRRVAPQAEPAPVELAPVEPAPLVPTQALEAEGRPVRLRPAAPEGTM